MAGVLCVALDNRPTRLSLYCYFDFCIEAQQQRDLSREEQCAFVVRETQEADDENLKTGLCYFAKESFFLNP